MEFWIRSGILEKQGIRNLIKSNTWDENSLCSNSFISGINIRFRIPCFSDRFLRVTRIPYPVSPVYSIREELLSISAFPKQTFLSQFLTKQKQRGVLIVKTATVPDCTDVFNKVPAWFSLLRSGIVRNIADRIQSTSTLCPNHLSSAPLKRPLCLCFMRICGGNFRTEGQKKRKSGEFGDALFRRWGQGIRMTLEWV